MDRKINIRKGNSGDWSDLARINHIAIRQGATAYTEGQRCAWSPQMKTPTAMEDRLAGQTIYLGETQAGDISGFLTLAPSGYIDFAYSLPEARGQGLFRQLYERLEREARAAWIPRLHTHASLHARPVFAHFGFALICPETVEVNGVWLPRFEMEKCL